MLTKHHGGGGRHKKGPPKAENDGRPKGRVVFKNGKMVHEGPREEELAASILLGRPAPSSVATRTRFPAPLALRPTPESPPAPPTPHQVREHATTNICVVLNADADNCAGRSCDVRPISTRRPFFVPSHTIHRSALPCVTRHRCHRMHLSVPLLRLTIARTSYDLTCPASIAIAA